MKKLCFAVICCFILVSCVSTGYDPFDVNTVEPVQKVIEFENVPQEDLFRVANIWMVNSFKSAESVIEFSDNNSGGIAGKYYSTFPYDETSSYKLRTKNSIAIEVKDNKVRITFMLTNIELLFYGTSRGTPIKEDITDEHKAVITSKWNTLLTDLENELNKAVF